LTGKNTDDYCLELSISNEDYAKWGQTIWDLLSGKGIKGSGTTTTMTMEIEVQSRHLDPSYEILKDTQGNKWIKLFDAEGTMMYSSHPFTVEIKSKEYDRIQ